MQLKQELMWCTAIGALALSAGGVQAQTARQEPAAVEEVIVTARKLGEAIQDAPVTVNVLSSQQLEQKGAVSANGLSGVVPGLVQMNGVGSLPATTFRGIGSNSSLFGVESSVAMVQDGVFLSRLRDFLTPLYDVDHLEFIKGTQSTLIGKNTTLGAITVVTRRPTSQFGYEVGYRRTFEVEGDRLDAAVNIPLADNLAVRVSGLYAFDEGATRNPVSDRNEPSVRDLSGRLAIAWAPSDALDIYASYQHDEKNQKGNSFEVLTDPLGAVALRKQAVGQTVIDAPADRIQTSGSQSFNSAAAGRDPYDDHAANHFNLIATYDLGGYTLTAQAAHLDWKGSYLTDLDFTQANLFGLLDYQSDRRHTLEMRLSSPEDRRVTYLVGAYYYLDTWNFRRQINLNSPLGLVPNQPAASASQGVYGVLSGGYDNRHRLKTTAYSIFGSATAKLTDKLEASAGLRQTWEDKDASFQRTGYGFFGAVVNPPIPATNLTREESSLDYDAGVRYRATEALMLYASYARGSKSGGFQETPTILAAAEYSGEVAKTAEVGAKLRLYGLGDVWASAFDTLVEDFQTNYTQVVNGVSSSFVGNVDLRTRGVEIGGTARPTSKLTLEGSATYADAQFEGYIRNAGANTPLYQLPGGGTVANNVIAYPGMRPARAPEFTARIEANYKTPISDALDLTVNGVLMHMSDAYMNNLNFATGDAPISRAHQDVSLRVSLANPARGWELSLIGDNLLDQDWVTFATRVTGDGTPSTSSPALGERSYYGSLNRPRTVAVQFKLKR